MKLTITNQNGTRTVKIVVREQDRVKYSGTEKPIPGYYHISDRQFARCERLLNGPGFGRWNYRIDSLGRPVVWDTE
jgi:hypothetical protein